MKRFKLSRALLLSLAFAAVTIATNPKDPESYQIAAAAIIGAASGGAKKKDKPQP